MRRIRKTSVKFLSLSPRHSIALDAISRHVSGLARINARLVVTPDCRDGVGKVVVPLAVLSRIRVCHGGKGEGGNNCDKQKKLVQLHNNSPF
jgi:hypothetical protein